MHGQSVIVAQIDGAALITAGKGKQQALGIGIVDVVARLATDRRGGHGRHPLATSAGMVVGPTLSLTRDLPLPRTFKQISASVTGASEGLIMNASASGTARKIDLNMT